eukprot:1213443-Amphidinium_carterae.1
MRRPRTSQSLYSTLRHPLCHPPQTPDNLFQFQQEPLHKTSTLFADEAPLGTIRSPSGDLAAHSSQCCFNTL